MNKELHRSEELDTIMIQMRLIANVGLALAALAIGGTGAARAGAPESSGLAAEDGETQFVARLYDHTREQKGNHFISPASIRLALALAYAGARGETATQLRDMLALAEGAGGHEQMAQLAQRFARGGEAGDVLRFASRLWAQRGHRFRRDFLARLRQTYAAPLGLPKRSTHI